MKVCKGVYLYTTVNGAFSGLTFGWGGASSVYFPFSYIVDFVYNDQ